MSLGSTRRLFDNGRDPGPLFRSPSYTSSSLKIVPYVGRTTLESLPLTVLTYNKTSVKERREGRGRS